MATEWTPEHVNSALAALMTVAPDTAIALMQKSEAIANLLNNAGTNPGMTAGEMVAVVLAKLPNDEQ